MKTKLTYYALAAMLFSQPVLAQIVSQDSLKALDNQKEAIKISQDINDKKIKLAEKQKDLLEKEQEMQKSAQKAQASADANRQAAADLTANPQDKKLSGKANSAAKDAQRDAKNARKDSEGIEKLNKDIAELQKDIQEGEQKLAGMGQLVSPASAATVTTPVISSQSTQNNGQITNSSGYAGNTSGGQNAMPAPATNSGNPNVIQRNITLDSANANNANAFAQRLVESTYKNYPQQQGQPAIIINNIIVPPNYNQQELAAGNAGSRFSNSQDQQDYEDYKAWLRFKRGESAAPGQQRVYAAPASPADAAYSEPMTREERLTFRERFGEKPARNSGLWVIPLVGIHASNFNANFDDGKYEGRSGWNAGLDFRFRMKKFFIQPGVHYLSSSMDVTSEDSVSTAPLLTGPRIHSLKAPLMLGVYLTKAKGGFFRFNIKGGVVGNYVLSVDDTENSRFNKDNIEEFSYGLNAGVGLEFGFVTLDLSHEWGMSPFLKANDQKNNVLRATLGFKL
ncbi:hypothetical protein DYBT9623_01777 [Dyadobacter sp. CECT 9623]|uniref:Outer membrane protein beta-barrel domain-containing protein n=1 Tax=Dyadobacter linearis TaxID=2823330 RepID=A0ABM8UNF4_9BACT|nr:outer membrane beta-barrel protein [Dyadobacter sp. CECT 9623]CAG5069043.1 hypothetical protein DYBT9623_01777 [Dyadobacter sp. CECT 9623]